MNEQDFTTAILNLLNERGPGKSICPSDAARALSSDEWRQLMPQIHEIARKMAREKRISLTQGGETVPPEKIRGAYRIVRYDG